MTSLQLFPEVEHSSTVPKEWGSGKLKEDVNVYIPGPPTFQYKGDPVEQFYTLTQLKLSNIRSNDELVPKPQDDRMGDILINKDFPAEHPYSSHIPRNAMFPTFDSPEDPKRGVNARREQPINAEMPATNYAVKVIHKTKGYGDRWEIQHVPKESEKKALEWPGEDGFHQVPKVHGGRPQYFPCPPKLVAPNLQANRSPSMRVSDKTANALRNVERDQWQTTYDLNHTGMGPANPMKLDNYAEKTLFKDASGFDDDNLYARSVNTFDPARPFEGRIARKLIPRPPPQKKGSGNDENTGYVRMMTAREKEEDRLWNGKEHLNLPDTVAQKNQYRNSLRWKEINDESHPDPNIQKLQELKQMGLADDIPFHPVVGMTPSSEENYLQTTKAKKDHTIQEIEAQNRFQVLEAQSPSHDIGSLNYKMQHVHEHEQPKAFYDHEGKFNEERAGMYRTSYLPERLANSMSGQEKSGPEIMNTMHSHVDAEILPTKLNQDMKESMRHSRTLSTSMPNLAGDLRESWEVIQPLQHVKEADKRRLQPTDETARVKVLEKNTILKDSETGDSFNTKKFLQEYELPKFARNEPLNVISNENKNLTNVRMASGSKSGQKSVSFSDEITVASRDDFGQMRIESAPTRIQRYKECSKENIQPSNGTANTAQYTSTHALWNPKSEIEDNNPNRDYSVYSIQPKPEDGEQEEDTSRGSPVFARKPRRRAYSSLDTEYLDQFSSYSTNVVPANLRHSVSFTSSYGNQFPNYQNMSYKHDPRFLWEPGMGAPRPQTKLLDIQNSFSKTRIRNNFHRTFPEMNSDLRENITQGKKHTFFGLTSQSLHG